MEMSQTFNRSTLADYLSCQRRYQLRYFEERPWPVASPAGQEEYARVSGERFHQLIHQYFLGLPVEDAQIGDSQLLSWWRRFKAYEPDLPDGDRLPELSLDVSLGKHRLNGRIDLLILSAEAAHIFDWKTTSRPKSPIQLGQDLQSKIYLALVVQAGTILPKPVNPDRLTLTYWYANDPSSSITVPYSQLEHRKNWQELQSIAAEIANHEPGEGEWTKTLDLKQCERCCYQILCGRSTATQDLSGWADAEVGFSLDPEMP